MDPDRVWDGEPAHAEHASTTAFAAAVGGGSGAVGASPIASVPRSGDQRIDGQLSGRKWADPITYSDPDSAGDYEAGYFNDGNRNGISVQFESFGRISGAQLAAVHAALAPTAGRSFGFSASELTTLDISYLGAGSGAGTLRFANSADPATAYAFYPSTSATGGDVWFGPSGKTPVVGTYHYHAVLHEVGHALGLKHGHETSTYGALPSAYDYHEYSLMTYRSYPGAPGSNYTNETYGGPQTFMMLDIAALQHMYGANFDTNSGNTTYRWTPGAGTTFVDGEPAIAPGGNRIFLTIWDGGGVDTYDLSAYQSNLSIDLRAGHYSTFSSVQQAHLGAANYARGNAYNALLFGDDHRSLIENAIGGAGNDTIIGNSNPNALQGRSGNDTLSGLAGNDVLDGGPGADTMTGGPGNDIYYVDNAGDKVRETVAGATGGADTVYGTASFTLGANVENLILTGSRALNGTGNALSNQISGNNGANTLRGLAGADVFQTGNGADVVIGGTGNDIFRYTGVGGSNPAARDIIRPGNGAVAFEKAGGALGDRFDFSAIDANSTLAGVQHFVFGTATGKGRLWAVNSGALTLIRGNVDNDAAPELEIALEDGAVLASAYTAADFLV